MDHHSKLGGTLCQMKLVWIASAYTLGSYALPFPPSQIRNWLQCFAF